MVREGIDRRRRALLGMVASGTGYLALGRPTAARDGDASHPGASMRGTDDGSHPGPPTTGDRDPTTARRNPAGPDGRPTGPDFLVFRDDGATRVSHRGADDPVFSGGAGAAIQHAVEAGAAADAGTAIAVAPGTYDLDRPVTLAPSTWLAGSGTATILRAGDGLNDDVLTVPAGSDHVRVSDLGIDGNRDANDRGNCLVVAGDAWRTVLEHLVVRNGAGDGVRFERGPDGTYSYEPTLVDVDVARCDGAGYVFGYTGDLFALNLYAESCGGYGFTLADAGGTVVHPHAYDTRGEAGIRVLESTVDTALLSPHSERNRGHGILLKGNRVTVRNAFVANNGRDAPGSYSGVVLDGARHSSVTGSTIVNDADFDPTQAYGLVETAESRENRVAGNLFQRNAVAPVDRASATGTTYRFNRGYLTENGGRTTAGDGASIPHGLAERPREYWVQSTGPGTYAHAVDVDGERFVVEVLDLRTGQPVDGDVDVVWGATAV